MRAEVENSELKWAAWGGSPGSGQHRFVQVCTLNMQGQEFVCPTYLVEVPVTFCRLAYCQVTSTGFVQSTHAVPNCY